MTLTLLVSVAFVFEGLGRCGLALRMKPHGGWLLLFAGGAAGILVGLMIFSGWPATAMWAVGMMIGINLVFAGVGVIGLAMALRRS